MRESKPPESKPGLQRPKPSPSPGLPEAFIKANQGPVRACGEIALPVWDCFGGPISEPPAKK
jgi:hypothetical protein